VTPERGAPLDSFAADETHGATLAWKRRADGSVIEVQADREGTILDVRHIWAEDVEAHAGEASAYLLPEPIRDGLQVPQGANAQQFVSELLGRHRSVSLGIRLSEDGSYRRALALLDGGVLEVSVDADGALRAIDGLEGFGGYLRMDLEDRTREALRERHETPVRVPTLGAAIAHARSAGSGVLSALESPTTPGEIRLVCEAPKGPTTLWFPHLAGVGRGEIAEVNRFTRAYRIADLARPDTTDLGPADAEDRLPAHRLSMLLSALTHPGRPGQRSSADVALALAVCHALHARLDGDEVPAEGSSRAEKAVRRSHPQHVRRQGLEALMASLEVASETPRSPDAPLLPLRASLTQQLTEVQGSGDLVGELIRRFAPRAGDAARAFTGEVGATVARAMDALVEAPPRAEPLPAPYTALRVSLAPAPVLGGSHALSGSFPGGYRRIAHRLAPEGIWATWVYHPPGQTSGLRMDGLVWLGDHWAWFPKPWKLLRGRA